MSEKKYLQLNNIDAYNLALKLSNYVWNLVIQWGWFPKQTVGIQFVKAADSISANIAEGFGRYFKKDKIKFYRYSQGSVKECFDWNQKSKTRGLIQKEEYQYIHKILQEIDSALRRLIKYTNDKLKL